MRLPDGRDLCYAITGDPAGPPVFYFHGRPASRLEAAIAGEMPVRLIAVDRPGYGGSSRQPGRRLLDWPTDVAALADHLALGRFHVVGVSGGAPFAIACAAALDRVKAAALIGPVPPLAGPLAPSREAMGEALWRLRQVGERPLAGRTVVAAVRLAVRAGLVDPRDALKAGLSPQDVACVTPALALQITGSWREGIRRGVEGAVSDARIYAADWEIDLAAVRVPVSIWHGKEDRVIPIATQPAYATLCAKRHLLDGEGHYSLPLTRAADVIADLVHYT